MSKKKLGRGLDALFGNYSDEEHTELPEPRELSDTDHSDAADSSEASFSSVQQMDPRILKPNPNQPRSIFSEKALEELSTSIKEHGIIQPIVITRDDAGNSFILAGERRTRAAIMAGLSEIPVIVADIAPEQNLELALIENIQRENLTPIEEARAYKKLLSMYDLSQDELAKKIGKSRPAVTNIMRLLQLPDYAIDAIQEGKLSQGHARTLLSLNTESERKQLFDKIINEGISVRDAENFASHCNAGEKHKQLKNKTSTTHPVVQLSPELASIQQKFLECLGTKVVIKGDEQSGVVEISYFSKDDLETLYDKILSK